MTVTYPTMTLHRRSSHLSRWRCANAEELAVQAEHSVAGAEAADELECILREQGISPGARVEGEVIRQHLGGDPSEIVRSRAADHEVAEEEAR